MRDRYLILTPEKVVVSYRLAGVGARVSAYAADLVIIALLLSAVSFLLGALTFPLGTEAVTAVTGLLFFVLFLGYPMYFEAFHRGQTPGKRAIGLRVVMADGTPVTAAAASYRNFLRLADMLPLLYLAGFLAIFTNARSQRLGDLAAGTIVVQELGSNQAFTPAPHRAGLHFMEPGLTDLRKMTMEEYVAIKRLCDRFPYLPPETQVQSLKEIWHPFATRVGVEVPPGVHPIYVMEAVVMKYGRLHKLI
ncbi:MAG: RDD family protein [Fimbriimonadaceae bacterium]|nr:RDD family protein [Fimbriimonadaceae bacterium]QYK56325.1 MAG: RDD family protein [Fimbriimonadaceae bacterium]